MFQWLFKLAVNLVYPPFCVECGRLGSFACLNCRQQIDYHAVPLALKLEPRYLDQAWAMAVYQPPVSTLIHALKYHHSWALAPVIAELMYETMAIPDCTCITAVPLHQKRQKDRGFNQAELMAKKLAQLCHKPYYPLIARTKNTSAQALVTDRAERLHHLDGAFTPSRAMIELSKSSPSLLNSVLIVDDVITTGSTLNEVARILKANGCLTVSAVAGAHG